MSLSWFAPIAGIRVYELASSELSGTFQNCTEVISLNLRTFERCLTTILYATPENFYQVEQCSIIYPLYLRVYNLDQNPEDANLDKNTRTRIKGLKYL